ncbi:uncharacterized protein E0L32_008207 [Thyridium curvatum]|uniref:Uncharacterized protein n=1 Tax=Thyridium curvatum TaxID=1093900 RepID=A0A507B1H0_9PEZI|nr:uncharacterized protein E0L32_008207 [Thyridium curvatum]TPX10818.1 hypothetical protein E0L32_008207 [Thyridium curvatum]
MASLLNLDNPALAYYSVPAALVLAGIPVGIASSLAGKNHDHNYPRRTVEKSAKDAHLSQEVKDKIERAKAANANACETLGYYAAAVVAAVTAGVATRTVNLHCAAYLASRVLYNVAYIQLGNGHLRGAVWITGIGIMTSLWIKAAGALAA